MKTCRACGQVKPLGDFYAHPHTKDRKYQKCKTCSSAYSRSYHRARKYGLSVAQLEALLEDQAGECAICSADLGTRYCVDHDHTCCPTEVTCGKCVRGLLCNRCNSGLGQFADSVDRLQFAIEYLRARPASAVH